MPYIYLGATYGSYPLWGDVKVTVSEQSYDKSNLFKKYTHKLQSASGGNIYLYKQSYYIVWYNYATLQPGEGEYQNAKLQSADVYFNRFDTAKPLVLVLHFEKPEPTEGAANGGGGSNGQTQKLDDMYWKYSEFSSQINISAQASLSGLTKFDESQLLEELIKENDKTNDSLTYDLHEKGNGSSGTNYRENKINVTSKQDVNGQDGKAKFYKHVHSPKYPPIVRKSYILYNNNVLMQSSDRALDGIQGQNYTSITVYFSKDDNNPLLIELDSDTGSKTYLKRVIGGSDKTLLWAKDDNAERELSTGGDDAGLTKYLDSIVISLDNRIYVILNEQQGQYGKSHFNGLKGSDDKTEVKLSKYQPETIEVDGGQELKNGVEPDSQHTLPYKKYTHTITVDNSTLSDVPPEVKSQAEFELIPSIPKVVIPIYDGPVGTGKPVKLTFGNGQGATLSTQIKTELSVYFYNHTGTGDGDTPDTVPLMLQHNGTCYAPKDRDSYFTGWEAITILSTKMDPTSIKNELDRVNKALNEVKIEETGAYGIEKPPGLEEQLTGGFSTDRINVECKSVGDGTSGASCPSPPGSPPCPNTVYTKYTHTTVNKYELGEIKYKGQDVKYLEADGGRGQPITVKPEQNLLEVYYMTDDTDHKYPLLIGIGKQPGSGGGASTYYRLKTVAPEKPGDYRWQQDREARSKVKGNGAQLVAYLNEINYNVKKVIKIQLEKNTAAPYQAHWSTQPGQTSGFTPVRANGDSSSTGNKEIQVEDCTNGTCSALGRYKCFQHKITSLGPEVLNQVGGIALTLPGKDGGPEKPIEIPLFNDGDGKCQEGENGNQPMNQLFYNKCMGDVYVFFYNGGKTDSVPLMLWYNKNYYKPKTRDDYFTRWVCVKELNEQEGKEPCGEDNGKNLADKLDEVNRALNTIDLSDKETGKGKDKSYGLPTDKHTLSDEVGNERVTVKTQTGPTKPTPNVYTRVIHRTKNGFTIGEIKYSGQEITEYGVTAALGASITLKRDNGNNHKESVTQYKWNTVVAYYSTSDKSKVLPQLIVILKTTEEVKGDGQDVKVSGNSYGYYILTNKDSGSGYEYKWVDVTEPGSQLTLDDETDFNLLNSVVILLDKQDKNGYNDSQISAAVRTAIKQGTIKSPGQLSDVNRINTKARISVSDASGSAGNCSNYGYKVYQHDFSTMVERTGQLAALKTIDLILGVRLLIPSCENGDTQYSQLSLSGGSSTSDGTHYLYYKSSQKQVWVYFYQGLDNEDEANGGTTKDPRPILLCYGNRAYKPKDKDEYDTTWTWASSINKCGCKSGANDELLKAVTSVVGFLNKVELQKRPGGGREGVCNGVAGVPTTQCTNGSNTCTYEVHQYTGKPINVRVVCKTIKGGEGPTTAQAGCYYMSMTHTPAGMNGDGGGVATNGAPGYRLGQVEYQGTGRASSGGNRVNYTVSSSNKWNPLVKVTTYYYSEDKLFTKPLLVVLEFKTGSSPGPPSPVKEYYKLTPQSSGTSGLSWTLDPGAEAKVKSTDGRDNDKLISYLDSIRFGLMKVVQIMISSTREYQFKTQAGTARDNRFTPFKNGVGDGVGDGGKQIEVQECTGCTKLLGGRYKCFVHKVTAAITGKEDVVGGIKLTVPGSGPTGDVEIPLHRKKPVAESNGSTEYEKIDPLTYNKCMGDIYVYFYHHKNEGGNETDNVPLMLVYNSQFYKPKTRDEYFNKWIPVEEMKFGGVKPEGGCGGDKGAQKLTAQLDEVNRELNRIQLDKARGTSYGLPSTGQGGATVNTGQFPTDRVNVVEVKPGTDSAKTYTRIVHRTKNGFTVGKLTSKNGQNDITEQGFQVTSKSGSATITVKNGARNGDNNHTVYTNSNKLNTVVVYYAMNDRTRALPQLMVLLHTDKAIEGGGDTTIKASKNEYGYYIITDESGTNYQYLWRTVDGKPGSTPVTLNDKTDFSLLNSVVILLEQRGTSGTSKTYGDTEIKGAIGSAINNKSMTESPGNSKDVNRLTGKTIAVADGDATTLSSTGFKLITHDISALVELNGSLKGKLGGVTLIGGLRFLIPTREQGKYKQVTLKENGEEPGSTSGGGLILYHKPSNNKVCVFFYDKDPRPLLLCYNGNAYKPTNKAGYFSRWHKDEKISKCDCQKPCEELLKELVNVSNFLNPLDIKIVPKDPNGCQIYYVHWFNGKGIKIKVECKPIKDESFCYIGLIHTHLGTSMCDCKGFRLGNIEYGCECIKLNGGTSGTRNGTCITASHESHPYKPSPEVVTYYYKGDKKYKNPLLVALKQGGKYQPYYELQRSTGGAGADKKYKKQSSSIDLDNTSPEGTLAQKLDEILNAISNKLQIILSERPLAKLLCPPGTKSKKEFPCEDRPKPNGQKPEEPAKHPPDKDGVIPPSYVAKLYPPNGQPLSTENKTTHVVVEEVRKCDALTSKGYRCYQHKLTEVMGIEEVGGLKLYLWAEQGSKGPENGFSLYECKNNGGQNGETQKIEKITYNTCKGNLYVYFYGEDPRPLMLCYDGKGYKPQDKGSYEKEWVCVPSVECVCDDTKFDAGKVLGELYKLSMELNEVQLGQTSSAYQKLNDGASHKYEVHTYNKTQVNVTVTGHDLSCYKQYVHRPEKGGYRLGNIKYNGQGSEKTGLKYTSSKQLISVSLYYYMYDKPHKYPLIVELGYKGDFNEYFRLNDPGNTGEGRGENGKTQIKWEKMDGNTGSCTNNQQNGPPGENGSQGPNGKRSPEEKKNTCQLDKEFARTAEELQRRIYESERGIPWNQRVYWYRVVDLEELIEARAYKIRKSLKLEYEKESGGKSNLILKTKDNCHEESVMGYVIGGGAVGVAGGG